MLAVLAPGQGAQYPGMLTPWLDLPETGSVIDQAAEVTGLDVARLGVSAGQAELRPTEIAQPLLTTVSLAGAAALAGNPDAVLRCDVVAGHSVGEWVAAVVCGALDVAVALRLIDARGRAMAAAAAASSEPTGMVAVLGGDEADVHRRLAELGLVAANINGARQVVAAGPVTMLAKLQADPPPRSRILAVDVAAAFHTPLMAPAEQALADAVGDLRAREPSARFVGNRNGDLLGGASLLAALVGQVTRPVRFDRVAATLRRLGISAVIELPPAGVLTALVKRELPGVVTCALKNPGALPLAHALIAEHAVAAA